MMRWTYTATLIAGIAAVGCGHPTTTSENHQPVAPKVSHAEKLLKRIPLLDGRVVVIPDFFESFEAFESWASSYAEAGERAVSSAAVDGYKVHIAWFHPYSGRRAIVAVVVLEDRGRLRTVLTDPDVPFESTAHVCNPASQAVVISLGVGWQAEMSAEKIKEACSASSR